MIHQQEVNPRTGLRASSNEAVSPRNILVATDFSGASNRALEHALCLARTYNSQIFLAHVVPLDLTLAPEVAEATQERTRRAARAGMDEIRASKCFFAVPHQEIVREGPLWPNIAALIEKYNIDLMVVGTHGVGPVKKLLIGSSAEHIFRQARIPVLTVGPDVHREPLYEIELKNILFATAFGPEAERQAAYAFSLAQQHRSRITLLHVEEHAGQELAIVHRLQELVPVQPDLHCLPLFRVEWGNTVKEILRAAQDTHADLIILGAKTEKSLAGHVPHTTAYQVVCNASCPVLTVKS